MSCGPPCPPCPPPTPAPCPQICPPPPPMPTCRPKPLMRGLHWAQTTSIIATMFVACAAGGIAYVMLVKRPRKARYREFYEKAELDDWAEEMAKKGLFQAVPPGGFKEAFHQSWNAVSGA